MIRKTTESELLADATDAVADAFRRMGVAARVAGSLLGWAWVELYRGIELACIREQGKLPGSHRTKRLRKKRRKAIERILEADT